jgi:hypothetical protein
LWGRDPVVHLIGGPVTEGGMGPLLVVSPEEVSQTPYCFPDVGVVFEIDLLVLDGPPEPLDEDVVEDPCVA